MIDHPPQRAYSRPRDAGNFYCPGEPVKTIGGFFPEPFAEGKYLRIYHLDHGGGFFVNLLYVINGIIFAEQNNLTPFVYLSDPGLPFFDSEHGENIWEYYFDPISDIDYRSLDAADVYEIDRNLLVSHQFHQGYPKGVQVYPYKSGIHRIKRQAFDRQWYLGMRKRAADIMAQHVRVKSVILDKVEQFRRRYFVSRPVLGAHVRATDKKAEIGGRQILAEEYFTHIDDYFDRHPHALLFCATDSPAELAKMRNRYAGRIVHYDALRDERNIFTVNSPGNYRKGEDALIDCLLLSKCDFLLKSSSAVSEFSIYFNPALHQSSLDLQYLQGYG